MAQENFPSCRISICMGSSCFSRGNNRNLEVIEEFVKENHLDSSVEIAGNLCEDKCNIGPNIIINGKLYSGLDPNSLLELLQHLFIRNKKLQT